MNSSNMRSLGFVVLRVGMALVFAWFGANQLLHPSEWVGFVPAWAHFSFITPAQIVFANGLFEVVAAALLVLNVFTRIVSLLLVLHLIGIIQSIGVNATGVRDSGLAIATLSLALIGGSKRA